jgi:aspartyl-tRNA(Asn)/glutamyl-tRNA(Gln) amidotransferase subunit C
LARFFAVLGRFGLVTGPPPRRSPRYHATADSAGWIRQRIDPDLPAMALTLDDVHRIAHLARIEIDATAAQEVHAKLNTIFAMINELQAVDTTGITPMAHAQDVMLPLRDDVVTETDQRALYQSVAPSVQDGLYLVPRVVE